MTTSSKIALGIVGAVAAGVVIGLLLAPEKGSETRKRIKRTAGEWADNLSQLYTDGKESVTEAIEKVKRAKSAAEEKVNKMNENLS